MEAIIQILIGLVAIPFGIGAIFGVYFLLTWAWFLFIHAIGSFLAK